MAEQLTTPQQPTTQTKPPEPKVLFYVLSFLIGLFGIIFGIIYMTKEGEENKKFGKICLLLGLLPMVLSAICLIITFILGIGAFFLPGATNTPSFNTSFNTY